MFLKIEAYQYSQYKNLLDQMFRLRKRVFVDSLNWDVPEIGGFERDEYDQLQPVYLLWTNSDQSKLIASLRLMPTTGPTLLNDVFRSTYPVKMDLSGPTIWEATRMCCDSEQLKKEYPEINQVNALSIMVSLICEVACQYGIDTVVSNYEPHIARIYRKAGAIFDEVGRADSYGKRPVCCGVFDASPEVLALMRLKMGLTNSILNKHLKDCWSNIPKYAKAC